LSSGPVVVVVVVVVVSAAAAAAAVASQMRQRGSEMMPEHGAQEVAYALACSGRD
jgi:hypothetical protein